MKKLREVEEAKALMLEAADWSVFRWLFEKRRVRETADRANAALDKLNLAVKARWSHDAKVAYKQLSAKSGRAHRQEDPALQAIDPKIRLFARKVREADDAAYEARMAAEDTFDDAERQLNTDLAREGCQKAIQSWEFTKERYARPRHLTVPTQQCLNSTRGFRKFTIQGLAKDRVFHGPGFALLSAPSKLVGLFGDFQMMRITSTPATKLGRAFCLWFSCMFLVAGFGLAQNSVQQPPPTIVFMTDFGIVDDSVALCKGVMYGITPNLRIVDLTHQVNAYSIQDGARFLFGPLRTSRRERFLWW